MTIDDLTHEEADLLAELLAVALAETRAAYAAVEALAGLPQSEGAASTAPSLPRQVPFHPLVNRMGALRELAYRVETCRRSA